MAKVAPLPAKWTIERTNQTYLEVNRWLNEKEGNPTAYEKSGGWVTNKTKRGTQPPLKYKPDSFISITLEQFQEHLLGVNPDNTTLPPYWAVKVEKTENFKKVTQYINQKFGTDYKGSSGYYGLGLDKQVNSRFNLASFDSDVTLLTTDQFLEAIKNNPEPVRGKNNRAVQPILPILEEEDEERVQVIKNYRLIKAYPGSEAQGSLVNKFNGAVKDLTSPNFTQSPEYYQPIMDDKLMVGDKVIFMENIPDIPNLTVKEISSISIVAGNERFTVVGSNNHYYGYQVRLATPEEIAAAEVFMFNNAKVELQGDELLVAGALYSLEIIKELKKFTLMQGNTARIGNNTLTEATLNRFLQFFD